MLSLQTIFLLCNLQAFVATHSGSVTNSYSLQLDKGKRSRLEEDAVASKLLLQAFGKACKLPDSSSLDLGLLSGSEQVQVQLWSVSGSCSSFGAKVLKAQCLAAQYACMLHSARSCAVPHIEALLVSGVAKLHDLP